MNRKNNKKGFTIVELVIVIAVIGILAAVLIPTFSGVISNANASARLQEARNAYTNYLSTATPAQIEAGVDYVLVVDENNNKYYYEVANEYAIDEDDKVCGNVLTVSTMQVAAEHAGTVEANTNYCNVCKPSEE